MKRSFSIRYGIVVLLSFVMGAAGYYGWLTYQKKTRLGPLPQVRLAIVDLSRLQEEGAAYHSFFDLMKRQHKKFHEDISRQEEDIRSAYEKIKTHSMANPQEIQALQEKKEKLNQEMTQLEKKIQDHKESLDSGFGKIKDNIDQTIVKIIQNIAKKRKLNLVLNKRSQNDLVVLYGSEELDITDEVLSDLNKEIPAVHLS